jgi:hypothetical protein
MPFAGLDERARAIINRYLDGQESFEVAARNLADLIREENSRRLPLEPTIRSPDGKPLVQNLALSSFIRSQTPETRANSQIPAPEPSSARDDDERVARLMDEARRLVLEDLK